MSAFEFVTVALSLVLGLALAYLLSSLLSVFRERRRCRLDWLPLVWALYVLAWQLNFWWVIYPLRVVEPWTYPAFLSLLLMTIVLFVAGGLVIPHHAREHEEGLRTYFERDGRWGVMVLGLYFVFAPPVNATLYGHPFTHPTNLEILGAGIVGMVFPFLRSRRARVIHTVVWGLVSGHLFSLTQPTI